MRLRSLALLACGLAACGLTASAASAQAPAEYVPYAVGDRWIYDVDGTTWNADTVHATVEWTVTEVRTTPTVDTLLVAVERRNDDGTTDAGTCRIRRERDNGGYLRLIGGDTANPAYLRVCFTAGGFPFTTTHYSGTPILGGPTAVGTATVRVGTTDYTREAALGGFSDSVSGTPMNHFNTTAVRITSRFAAGIGQVEMRQIQSHNVGSTVLRRDTLDARLDGAEVGGIAYGSLAVAGEGGPAGTPEAFAVRVGPNPVRGTATVWLDRPATADAVVLTVVDALGRTVRTVRVAGAASVPLDVSGLAPGLYVVRAEAGGAVAQARLVVAR